MSIVFSCRTENYKRGGWGGGWGWGVALKALEINLEILDKDNQRPPTKGKK